ncbi:mechanosensitive ion channel family protein [Shewanella woodyi]|uniref:mechanosensitive ion channel family protein n=1 Tax=Shewanella woodyi TaxID=60961 RepID=UPI003748EBE8
MHRIIALIMLAIVGLSSLPAQADTSSELTSLQTSIQHDVALLSKTHGELTNFTEYKIKQNTELLHEKLKELMAEPDLNKEMLSPIIKSHLIFIGKVDNYFKTKIATLQGQLGKGDDNKIMMQLSMLEAERDQQLQAYLDVLGWAKTLGLNTGDQTALLTKNLIARADGFNSFVQYTQDKLKQAIKEVSLAGKDVTAEQTLNVTDLKERLSYASSSLGVAIHLLDILGQDTADMKETLFKSSGDITQDVLNIDVASSLFEQWLTSAQNYLIENGPGIVFKLFIFVLILVAASLIGKAVQKLVRKAVSNSKLKFSVLLQEFFISLSGKATFTLGVLIALSQLGIELAPLLAGFGVAGVIIGFALQDTLSNFASGMMILVYRPYDVGDLINAAGVTGKVSHMSLVSTTIKTLDNQRLIIPNNKIWGDTINNITVEHQRRVDMTFGIGYGDDIEKTEKVLKEIIMAHPKVLKTPEPTIKLHTLGESSVDFIVRPWAKPEDYWDVYWDITRTVKMRFDAENISIPFPQRDIHIYQESV